MSEIYNPQNPIKYDLIAYCLYQLSQDTADVLVYLCIRETYHAQAVRLQILLTLLVVILLLQMNITIYFDDPFGLVAVKIDDIGFDDFAGGESESPPNGRRATVPTICALPGSFRGAFLWRAGV